MPTNVLAHPGGPLPSRSFHRRHRRSLAVQIADFFDGLGQGLRAAHAYRRLTLDGVKPADAARRVFEDLK